MATNIPATKNRNYVLIPAALVFTAVGVGTGVWLLLGIVSHWRMQSWEEAPATIVWAKLEENGDSEGGTTYRATAEYTYQYGGRQYTGNRVGIQGGGDNVGSFQQDAHRQLCEHQKSGRPFRCYVNPARPDEAILFRDLRWEMVVFDMVFATLFGSAGFGLLTFAVLSYRKAKGSSALAAIHPDEPWLYKTDWADGKIKSSTGATTLLLFVIAFVWNLMSAPAFLVIRDEALAKGNRWALLVLFFPAIGLILILCLIVSLLRWRKYGRSVFEMAAVPGVIGGQLAGVIRTSAKVQPEDGFRLALNCFQKVTHGDNTTVTTLWQDEQVIAHDLLQSDSQQSAIPVLFQIPYDCRPTDETNADGKTNWRLDVSAKTPGLDYSTNFEVPVFKTSQSDPNFVVDRSLIAEYAAPEDPDRDLRDAGVVRAESSTGEGCRLVFPMVRAPIMAAVVTLSGFLFGGVPFFVCCTAPAEFWFAKVACTVLFGGFGLLLLIVAADVWFYRSVVDVSASGLTVTGGWFGLGRQRRIEAADVEKITPVSRMSAGGGQGKKMYYDIDILRTTGKKVTAGKRLPSKRLADSVIRQIEQALGRQ